MNDKFFPELARRLKRESIDTAPVEKDCLPVLADGRATVLVMPRGTVTFNADVERGPEADSVYDLTFRLSREVYEYTEAMAAAPQLKADGLHEDFRLLAEFNGVVLAANLFYPPDRDGLLANLLFTIAYDMSYLGIEAALTMLLLCIPAVCDAIYYVRFLATTPKSDPTLRSF